MARVTLDQVHRGLENHAMYRDRVRAVVMLRNRLRNYSSPPWVLEDEVDSEFPGCCLQVVFRGESKEEEIRVSIVAWDETVFYDLHEEDNWLEVAVVVGGHVREPTRCHPDDVVDCVESLARTMATLFY